MISRGEIPDIDAIIHLAGKAHDTKNQIAAENYIIEKFAPEALKRPFHNFTDADAVVGGKKVYIMRPCMIHGPGNKGNLKWCGEQRYSLATGCL